MLMLSSHLSSIDEGYYARVEQEHSQLLSINEDYYARVEQEHSQLSSIDEDYYARVEQEQSPPSQRGNVSAANIKCTWPDDQR